jgi:hypothetical protein
MHYHRKNPKIMAASPTLGLEGESGYSQICLDFRTVALMKEG